MEEKLIFRLSLKCGLIVNEANKSWMHGKTPGMLRSAALEEHIWNPSKCPGGVAKMGLRSPAPSEAARGERGRAFKNTRRKERARERVGLQGLICSVEQLFFAELPVLSALKEILCHASTIAHRHPASSQSAAILQNTKSMMWI